MLSNAWKPAACAFSLSGWFVIAASEGSLTAPPGNPFFEAPKAIYQLDSSQGAVFQCDVPEESAGLCTFVAADYDTKPVSSGATQLSEMAGGSTTWAPKVSSETLTFPPCTSGHCIVDCLEYCRCTLAETGAACAAGTLPPKQAPKPPAAEPNCAVIENTEFCPTLMEAYQTLHPGNDFFCYNFCNGTFLSTCDEDGQCGPTVCEGSDPGTSQGLVAGCKDADILPPATAGARGTKSAAVVASGTWGTYFWQTLLVLAASSLLVAVPGRNHRLWL